MMKRIIKGYTISLVMALIIFLSNVGSVHANFIGTDDFNDNSVDTVKWGMDYTYGGAFLTETNSQLEYTSAVSGGGVEHPWILNQGSYTQGWSVQLDVGIGNLSLPSGLDIFTSVGLIVENNDDPSDHSLMALELDNYGTGRHIGADVRTNNISYGATLIDTTSYNAALQIAFDSQNELLSFQYDTNGLVGGYDWITLHQENISSLWNMTDSSVFNVRVIAGSSGIAVNSGLVTADNFLASPVPEPTTLLLFSTGLGALGLVACRRKRK